MKSDKCGAIQVVSLIAAAALDGQVIFSAN
jgi:hypothetical protein